MKTFKIGDLVVSAWGQLQVLGDDLGVVLGQIEAQVLNCDHFKQDCAVYNVYWFQAGQTYPVFSHDLTLYEREQ